MIFLVGKNHLLPFTFSQRGEVGLERYPYRKLETPIGSGRGFHAGDPCERSESDPGSVAPLR